MARPATSVSLAVALLLAPAAALLVATPAAGYAVINITAPGCGDIFVAGSAVAIEWTSSDTSGFVNIDLYIGWSFTPIPIVANTTDDGSYLWVIPANQTPANDAYLVISDPAEAYSDSYGEEFAIVAPNVDPYAVTITSPTNTTSWEAGQNVTITWSGSAAVGSTVDIEIDYLYFSAPDVIVSSTSNNGSYVWSIPRDQTARTTYLLRIFDSSNSSVFGQSACFTTTPRVPPGTIVVTQPGTGDDFEQGAPVLIQWGVTGTVGPYVSIAMDDYYFTGGVTVAANTSNNGTFWWTIPAQQTPRTSYFFRITDLSDDQIYGESDMFSVHAPPPAGTITVHQPAASDRWPVGATYTIEWTSTGAVGPTVRILLDRHTIGYTFTPELITSAAPNTGIYTWDVPLNHSYGVQFIRVVSVSDPSIEGASGDFQLVEPLPPGAFTITSPVEGDVLDPGIPFHIEWDESGDLGDNVRIEVNNGSGMFTVWEPTAPNTGTYQFTPTTGMAPGNNYVVRVVSISYPAATATSAAFTITSGGTGGSYILSWPAEGTVVAIGTHTIVRWVSQGAVGDLVKVELVPDNQSAPVLLATGTWNAGVFDWTPSRDLVPEGAYRFRLTSLSDPSIVGVGPRIQVNDPYEPVDPGNGEPIETPPPADLTPLYVGVAGAAAAAAVVGYFVVRRRAGMAREAANQVIEVPAGSNVRAVVGPTPPMPRSPPPASQAAPAPVAPAAPPPLHRSYARPPAPQVPSPPPASYAPPAPTYAAPPPAAAPAAQMAACPQCGRPCAVLQPKCGWCGLEMVWS